MSQSLIPQMSHSPNHQMSRSLNHQMSHSLNHQMSQSSHSLNPQMPPSLNHQMTQSNNQMSQSLYQLTQSLNQLSQSLNHLMRSHLHILPSSHTASKIFPSLENAVWRTAATLLLWDSFTNLWKKCVSINFEYWIQDSIQTKQNKIINCINGTCISDCVFDLPMANMNCPFLGQSP